jgi:protein-L-isoaspartate(D-aspartate) O-methyltransferase
MTEFATARENMVESQVRPNGITDRRITLAMGRLAREEFVPETCRAVAYMDEDVPLGVAGRSLVEPMAFARLVQLAEVKPEDKVLCVGAATGYGSAVLAELGGQVVALEQDEHLLDASRNNLKALANVKVVAGALAEGCAAEQPFDVILIEGRVAEVPEGLLKQLAPGGRLVAIVGETDMARAFVYASTPKGLAVRGAFDASVAALPGFEKKRPAFVF